MLLDVEMFSGVATYLEVFRDSIVICADIWWDIYKVPGVIVFNGPCPYQILLLDTHLNMHQTSNLANAKCDVKPASVPNFGDAVSGWSLDEADAYQGNLRTFASH
jgi:hypothetical protein